MMVSTTPLLGSARSTPKYTRRRRAFLGLMLSLLLLSLLYGHARSSSASAGRALMQQPPAAFRQQSYIKASNTDAGDSFGSSLAISGDTMVIGAPAEDSASTGIGGNQLDNSKMGAGAVYVFVRTGETWQQQAYLKASNPDAGDSFGKDVAISGDTIVVSAHEEDSASIGVNGDQNNNSATNAGAAYVFVRTGETWQQQAYLKASNTDAGDNFGWDVSVAGDTIVVGAPWEASASTGINNAQQSNSAPYAGAAYVFVRTGETWQQQAYLKASNTEAWDRFGQDVSIAGDTIVIGAAEEASAATGVNGNQHNNNAHHAGAAYVFVRAGTTWQQQAYLKASNTEAQDIFGANVAISGDTIVVSATGEDSAATGTDGDQLDNSLDFAGAAYVFVRTGTTWQQQAYLKASNPDQWDSFGWEVAVSGDMIVVGAGEDSSATGVNGDHLDNSAERAGAAYVFVRRETEWRQQAYLKASNTDWSDDFSWYLDVEADTIIVGAHAEASAGIGLNADQLDNSAGGAGAVYVFSERALPDHHFLPLFAR